MLKHLLYQSRLNTCAMKRETAERKKDRGKDFY